MNGPYTDQCAKCKVKRMTWNWQFTRLCRECWRETFEAWARSMEQAWQESRKRKIKQGLLPKWAAVKTA